MSAQLSRRTLLRNTLLAGAAIPLSHYRSLLNTPELQAQILPSATKEDYVRLSHNENPYGPSERAREAVLRSLDQGNRYPREAITELQERIAAYEGLTPDQILITSGSSELLGLAGCFAGMHTGNVISCHPTFPVLMLFAEKMAARWIKVPLGEDHGFDLAGMNAQVNGDTRMVFICNPNNPTGTEIPKSMLEPFVSVLAQRCYVYVDEAYIEFATNGLSASLASLTATHPQLIIGRTFSKIYGLAGLRVGYAIAHPDTISALRNLNQGNSITPSVPSTTAAAASLGDQEFIDFCLEKNRTSMEILTTHFHKHDVAYIPSKTNFVFYRTDRFSTENLAAALSERKVHIRTYGDVPGWARVSLGTPEEMAFFVKQSEALLA